MLWIFTGVTRRRKNAVCATWWKHGQVFFMKFLFKETPNSTCTTLPPFLNSTQQPGCILAMLFCPRDFVELASGYIMYGCSWSYVQQYFEPNDPCSSKDSEKGIKCLEKCILLTLGHLQVFLLASNFESDILMSPKHLLAAEYTSKWQPPKSLLSRQISSG